MAFEEDLWLLHHCKLKNKTVRLTIISQWPSVPDGNINMVLNEQIVYNVQETQMIEGDLG